LDDADTASLLQSRPLLLKQRELLLDHLVLSFNDFIGALNQLLEKLRILLVDSMHNILREKVAQQVLCSLILGLLAPLALLVDHPKTIVWALVPLLGCLHRPIGGLGGRPALVDVALSLLCVEPLIALTSRRGVLKQFLYFNVLLPLELQVELQIRV